MSHGSEWVSKVVLAKSEDTGEVVAVGRVIRWSNEPRVEIEWHSGERSTHLTRLCELAESSSLACSSYWKSRCKHLEAELLEVRKRR